MPVTLELRENGRVLYFTFIDPWEVSQVAALNLQSIAYLNSAKCKLYTFTDLRQARRIPSGLLSLRHGPDWSHPNSGQIAILGASPLLTTFAKIVFRLSGFERIRFFDAEEEAWAYLRQLIADEAEIPSEG
jgi:hypothetical protein